MPFIETVSEREAAGPAAEQLEADRERFGYVPNMGRLFALRPEVYAAWKQLNGAIKGSMDRKRMPAGASCRCLTRESLVPSSTDTPHQICAGPGELQ